MDNWPAINLDDPITVHLIGRYCAELEQVLAELAKHARVVDHLIAALAAHQSEALHSVSEAQ